MMIESNQFDTAISQLEGLRQLAVSASRDDGYESLSRNIFDMQSQAMGTILNDLRAFRKKVFGESEIHRCGNGDDS